MCNVPLRAPVTQDKRHGLSHWLPWCQARCLLALSGYWVQVKSVGAWTSQPSPKNVFTSSAFDLDQSSIGMLKNLQKPQGYRLYYQVENKEAPGDCFIAVVWSHPFGKRAQSRKHLLNFCWPPKFHGETTLWVMKGLVGSDDFPDFN